MKLVGRVLLNMCLFAVTLMATAHLAFADVKTDPALEAEPVVMAPGDSVDLYDYITYDTAFDGIVSFTVSAGEDLVSLEGSTLTSVTEGRSRVTVRLGSTETFERAVATITIRSYATGIDDETAFACLSPDAGKSFNFYDSGTAVYMGRGAELTLISTDANYDRVTIDVTAPEGTTSSGGRITTSSEAESGMINGSFFLYINNNPYIRTGYLVNGEIVDNMIPTGRLFVDTDTPSVLFTAASYDPKEDFNIQIYNGNRGDGTITIRDTLSGVAKARYAIIDRTDLSEEDVREIMASGTLTWRELTAAAKDIHLTKESPYTVIVSATDNVGNRTTATSEGLVLDMSEAVIELSEIRSEEIYGDDITYRCTVESPFADIESVAAYITVAGQKQPVISDPAADPSGYFNGSVFLTENTLQFLRREDGTIVFYGKIDAASCASNGTVLEIEATDALGRTSSVRRTFVIDTVAPALYLGYDNNDARSGSYFNDGRTMTLTVVEQNFDESLLKVTVSRNGEEERTYTIAELMAGSVKGIKAAGEKTDSEDGKEESEHTPGRTITYTLGFCRSAGDEDASYRLAFSCADTAGHVTNTADAQGSQAPFAFTIDRTSPVLSLNFTNAAGKAIKPGDVMTIYERAGVNASLSITEKNFYDGRGGQMSIALGQFDLNGNAMAAYPDSAVRQAEDLSGWSSDGDRHTFTMAPFTGDANYSMSAVYTDLAGNTAQAGPFLFTVDRTPPTGVLSYSSGNRYGTLTSSAFFEIFTRDALQAGADASDAVSGIREIGYAIYRPGEDASGTFGLPSASSLTYRALNGPIDLSAEQMGIIFLRMVDGAGNTAYINSNGFIVDKTAPDGPVITITAAEPTYGIYRGDVPFTVSVSDPTAGSTYAGLKSLRYAVARDGSETQSEDFRSMFSDPAARVKSFSTKGVVSASLNNSNNVVISAVAEDMAGNVSSKSVRLSIDTTAPVIEVSYDNNDVRNGRYFASPRVATVTVKERNFAPELVTITTTTDGKNPDISSWSSQAPGTSGDGSAHSCTVSFPADGAYTFTVSVRDMALNESSYGKVDNFVIDMTRPEAGITFDNNEVSHEKYYGKKRVATVTVDEKNFSADKIGLNISSSLDRSGDAQPSEGSWKTDGTKHTIDVTFPSDGTYTLRVTGADLAENGMEEKASPEFVIDMTAPSVTVFDVENEKGYNGEISPKAILSDRHIDAEASTFEAVGNKGGTLNASMSEGEDGISMVIASPDKVIANDDIYTVRAHAVDLAGNISDESLTCSINRFGSNFTVSDSTRKLLDRYYINTPEDLVIYEVNVSGLMSHSVRIGHNAAQKELSEGTDYELRTETDTFDWKKYSYTIDKSVITENGHYSVIVTTEDEAGNGQTNIIKGVPIEFIYDTTTPVLIVTGVDDGATYDKAPTMNISVTDNIKADAVRIFKDGILIKTIDTEAMDSGKTSLLIEDTDGFSTFRIEAKDAAGNTTEKTLSLFVSSNRLKYLMTRYPYLIPAALFLFGAAGVAAVLLILRGRKKRAAKR